MSAPGSARLLADARMVRYLGAMIAQSPQLLLRSPLRVVPATLLLAFLVAGTAAPRAAAAEADVVRVLIVDGQNNHKWWPATTAQMKHILDETGRFEVDIARTRYTWADDSYFPEYELPGQESEHLDEAKPDPDFAPNFSDYDVVISNFGWRAAPWPEQTRADFESYVKGGGGFVCVHAADNSFPDWNAYNEMIGLGGWGGRTEKDGPYVYYQNDELVTDDTPGPGGHHGPRHAYPVVVRDTEHPITRDMPREWMHQIDELYDSLRGPAKQMQVLATSPSTLENGGSGRHEPVAMVISYGDGRVFHTVLGDDMRAMECVGFQTLLSRGTEWAATGEVTLTIPENFPSADEVSTTPFEAGAAALQDAVAN